MWIVCWQTIHMKYQALFGFLTFCGCSMAVTNTEPGGFMVLCPEEPEGSTGSGSGWKRLRR